MGGWMDVWGDGWMVRWMDEWIGGWMEGDGWMEDGWVDRRMEDGYVDGWMDGLKGEWMGGWMEGGCADWSTVPLQRCDSPALTCCFFPLKSPPTS